MTTPRINNQLDTPDTSREAVSHLIFAIYTPIIKETVRALLDERDALKAERDAARRAAFECSIKLLQCYSDHNWPQELELDVAEIVATIRSLADKEG